MLPDVVINSTGLLLALLGLLGILLTVTDLFTLEDDKSSVFGDLLSTFSFCLTLDKGSCLSD
jgi:hypothetical protein